MRVSRRRSARENDGGNIGIAGRSRRKHAAVHFFTPSGMISCAKAGIEAGSICSSTRAGPTRGTSAHSTCCAARSAPPIRKSLFTIPSYLSCFCTHCSCLAWESQGGMWRSFSKCQLLEPLPLRLLAYLRPYRLPMHVHPISKVVGCCAFFASRKNWLRGHAGMGRARPRARERTCPANQ